MYGRNGTKYLVMALLLAVFVTGCGVGGTGGGVGGGDDDPLAIAEIRWDDSEVFEFPIETAAEDIADNLPGNVTVVLNDSTEHDPTLIWTAPENFDATEAGYYTFTGEFVVEELIDSVNAQVTLYEQQTVEVSSDITEDTTWTNEYHYLVTDRIDVLAALTIEAGTKITFHQSTELSVESDGRIIAGYAAHEGADPVLMTADDPYPGRWRGVVINTDHPENLINNVIIEYAGGSSDDYGLYIRDDARVQVHNSTFRHNEGAGIYLRRAHPETTIRGSEMTNNTVPMSISYHDMGITHGSNTHTGNQNDWIDVYYRIPSRLEDVTETWSSLDVPYVIDDFSIGVYGNSEITVEPGAHFKMGVERRIGFTESSQLQAVGTAANPIIFEAEHTGTHWDGFYIRTQRQNRMEHVLILDAGNVGSSPSGTSDAALNIGSAGRNGEVAVSEVTIRNSLTRGVALRDGFVNGSDDPTTIADAFTFENNAGDNILVDN